MDYRIRIYRERTGGPPIFGMYVRPLVIAAMILSASCSDDAPTAPTRPLPLTAGSYRLYLEGDPLACSDVFIPPTNTAVQALSVASPSGAEWVVRPANQTNGDFELRLAAAVGTTTGLPRVTGTARGQVLHSYGVTLRPPAERASFSTLPLNGEFGQNETTIVGRLNGQVLFARENLIAVCPPGQVTFVLSRVSQ